MIPRRAKDQAMAHQKVSLAHDEQTPEVFDCSDAGTGKTFVRIMAFAKRRRKGGGKAIVLCTRSTMHTAWAADFKKFAPDMHVVVAEAKNRQQALAIDADVYVLNHDAIKDLAKKPKSWFADFDEFVVDESTAFKHFTSGRSRAAAKVCRHFKRRAAMTATPNSVSILDVWHQVFLLDEGKRLGPSYYGFRNTVCTPKQIGRSKNAIEWTDKDGAEEAVFGLLSDIVIRHKLDDCADIPQTYHHVIDFDMAPAHRKVYDQLEMAQILAFIPDLVTEKLTGMPAKVTAINAASVMTKLLQVCSGAVYTDSGDHRVVATERYELIHDLCAERPHALVFFQWQHQKQQLVEIAEARKIKYAVIDGSTPDGQRTKIIDAYQRGEYDAVFGHPKTMAHGLTLTKGTSTIWCGPTYDLELFEQGNKRQRRIGQKHKTEVIVVKAPGTVEDKVYDMLMAKDKRMKSLLSLFESIVADGAAKTKLRKKAA